MSADHDLPPFEQPFSGVARLFPLPNLVLFPHVMQPLHVFEARYRELTADALAGDQTLCMAVLAPGWEPQYEDRPPLYPTACLARIVRHQLLDDGRYNLLIVGLRRVRIRDEHPPDRPYRLADVDVLDDILPAVSAAGRPSLRRKLVAEFQKLMPNLAQGREQLDQLLRDEISLSILTDVVSYSLEVDLAAKLELLSETNVDRRAQRLLAHLEQFAARNDGASHWRGEFPPKFSVN